MHQEQSVDVDWQTSTFCATANCVQVAQNDDTIMVRDSKDPEGGVLRYTPDEWSAFLDGIVNGDFASL
ncbi:DUF397 domain-containing protein [Actinoplanes sp. NPDC051851]|uniref:DUF397 domain-containing protein n=1 Tax=Actinoplanes sp. NPDC051851 TaxID=3154753 RepID=UPI00342ACC10